MGNEVIIAFNGGKRVISSEFSIFGSFYQVLKHCPLQCFSLAQMSFQDMLAMHEYISYYLS